MIRSWQLQEAKNKLSHVVDDAVNEGPQVITKHGVEVAIVISFGEYKKMIASRGKLSTFFQDSPLSFNMNIAASPWLPRARRGM